MVLNKSTRKRYSRNLDIIKKDMVRRLKEIEWDRIDIEDLMEICKTGGLVSVETIVKCDGLLSLLYYREEDV
jgi:hypothetical protein